MTQHMKNLIAFALFGAMIAPAEAQNAQEVSDGAFSPENAIVDTALPFAIGAQEARQELRGAFGWSTFQEGLVQGVYFRFDPDGYARFAPTPRLDVDVFEVLCRPRTTVCLGRKEALQAYLNARGLVQLKYDGVTPDDRFFLVDGLTELELPDRILQPLDPALESLLMSGGDLVVRRGENEVERLSLVGFAAVIGYLRWVAAGQDYSVLPRGWPIPTSGVAQPVQGLTARPGWQTTGAQQPFQLGLTDEALPERIVSAPAGLSRVTGGVQPSVVPKGALSPLDPNQGAIGVTQQPRAGGVPVLDLGSVSQTAPGQGVVPAWQTSLPAIGGGEQQLESGGSANMARRLTFLLDDIGLDLETALMVLRLSAEDEESPTAISGSLTSGRLIGSGGSRPSLVGARMIPEMAQPLGSSASDQTNMALVDMISRSLPADAGGNVRELPLAGAPSSEVDEFKLLSEYFRSVLAQVN